MLPVTRFRSVKKIQRVMPDNVCVPIVMDDHVHFRDARQFFVDLHSEEVLFSKIMPIREVACVLCRVYCMPGKAPVSVTADVIQCVKKKSTGAAGWIQHQVLALGR